MGINIPHYLYVGGYSKEKVLNAQEKAKKIFDKQEHSELVSPLKNVSFSVFCDSGHARWENEEEYMEARRSYIQYLVEVDIKFVEIAAKELIS
ncbi:hypothetical protein [Bacillus cereus group sp. BfR-BA-01347]|uniref:hypothetical protein n=1 Tax=Bacillus cereus group sp. BfR-BA-01347 TaxID=2920310 RepID=UPI001F594FB4|nr:hypothetical protein [Bacillus cereus group sp. BfR-BA-01347]